MFLLLVGLACLFPLSLYCLYMAMLHQRSRPTMMAGTWDFAAVLFALSGFLIIGATIVVFSTHSTVRDFWLVGRSVGNLQAVHMQLDAITFFIWGAYCLILIGGSTILIFLRRDFTSIYQLSPVELEELLSLVLNRLNLSFDRRGPRWTIAGAKPEGHRPSQRGELELDGSDTMRNCTMRWRLSKGSLRDDVETELARELIRYESDSGGGARWFLTAATVLFIIMSFFMVTFLLISFRT